MASRRGHRATIHSVLSQRNPDLSVNPLYIKPGPNTRMNGIDFDVNGWRIWDEFNERNLHNIFEDVVDKAWRDPPHAELLAADMIYGDEDGLEFQILRGHNIRMVNFALAKASEILKQEQYINIGRRGRVGYGGDGRFCPDWTLSWNSDILEDGRLRNLLPGDTKLGVKWAPDTINQNFDEWSKPVIQLMNYVNDTSVRYGFLISDQYLVVFRFMKEHTGVGIAAQRQRRNMQAHQRVLSDDSVISEQFKAMSVSTAPYEDTGKAVEFAEPEYRAIPWSNHGRNKLTVNKGLFYLCMMAARGLNDLRSEIPGRSSYPRLDTWSKQFDGMYRHNTSGITKKKLQKGDEIADPDQDGGYEVIEQEGKGNEEETIGDDYDYEDVQQQRWEQYGNEEEEEEEEEEEIEEMEIEPGEYDEVNDTADTGIEASTQQLEVPHGISGDSSTQSSHWVPSRNEVNTTTWTIWDPTKRKTRKVHADRKGRWFIEKKDGKKYFDV